MTDTLKRSDQIALLKAVHVEETTGSRLPVFTYPRCGWDLVQMGLATEDAKLTPAGRAALWLLGAGPDPTDSASSVTFALPPKTVTPQPTE